MILRRLLLEQFIKSLYLQEAVNKQVIQQIKSGKKLPVDTTTEDGVKRVTKNSNLPTTDDEFNTIMTNFELMCPDKKNPNPYMIFLANTSLQEEPEWLFREDKHDLVALLNTFHSYVIKGKIPAEAKDITKYTRSSLRQYLDSLSTEKHVDGLSEEALDVALAGARVIVDSNGWKIWRVPKGKTRANVNAAWELCKNSAHGTVWCVGREPQANQVTSYLAEGDFFVIAKDSVSKYAISTHMDLNSADLQKSTVNDAILWGKSDNQLFHATKESIQAKSSYSSLNIKSTFPRIFSTLTKEGISPEIFLSGIAYIPEEIKPILKEAKNSPEFSVAAVFHEDLLNVIPKASEDLVFRVLHSMSPEDIVSDINTAMSSYVTENGGISLINYVITPNKGIVLSVEQLEKLTSRAFLAYLELHCGKYDRNMSKEIHDFLYKILYSEDNG